MSNIQEVVVEVVEEICDKYCKFNNTIHDDGSCAYMRANNRACYLDRLIKAAEVESEVPMYEPENG